MFSSSINRNSQNNDIIFYQKNIHKVGVDGGILVKFSKNANKSNILKIFNLEKLQAFSDVLWLVKTNKIYQTLSISNALYKRQDVIYAHPDFIKKVKKRSITTPKDPLFKDAWYLKKNDLSFNNPAFNISEIFKITKGDGVSIGIIDDGLDVLHEDLDANIASYIDLNNPKAKPDLYLFSQERHGTMMSGIIVGIQNDKGSVGIAPKSKLYFAKHNNERRAFLKVSEFIRGFKVLNDTKVSVISNSWGTYDVDEALKDYIDYISNDSRNGQGRVVVFASGNDSYNLDKKSYNDESEISSVLGVTTVDRYDKKLAYFSNYGSRIDLATIGKDIVTTASHNKYSTVSGTSPSAAIVSSVAGLVYSVNPNLKASMVKNILKQSATFNVTKESKGYPVLNAYNAIKIAISMQNLYDVEMQMLYSPIKDIVGEFAYFDFADTPDYLDWILIKDNKYYRLMGKSQNSDNKLGFKQIDKINGLKTSFYLINRFGLSTFASEYWVLVNKTSSSVYLMNIEDKKISYKMLEIQAKKYTSDTVVFRRK
ncbi:Cell wall-associated protease precursor [hydrothermal vent metagenome]|uniref:Cell wall-associated protease n=1 Tax=hydrothermal vent metagenome TaxID=652676 RepID=A0A3B1DR09_9ZZZZ